MERPESGRRSANDGAGDFTDLELSVLKMQLAGEEAVLGALREQLRCSRCRHREMTGVGFFTSIEVPASCPRAPLDRSLQISNVLAAIEGLEHGAGFVLFVNNGLLSTLEGYTYDEPWPQSVRSFTLRYRQAPRDLSKFRQE